MKEFNKKLFEEFRANGGRVGGQRDEIFDKVVAAAPGFGEYQSKTSRIIPLFELARA
jgi:hypothetical protein